MIVVMEVLDADDVFDGSVPPGGWVCASCRRPTETEPCRDHQPNAAAEVTG